MRTESGGRRARRLKRAVLAAGALCALYACARKDREWSSNNAFVVQDAVPDVKTLRAKELAWKPAAVRDLMRPGDKLQTFAGASATIGLKNDQQLFVRELTLLVFGDYDKDDARARTTGLLEIQSGQLQTRSLDAARGESMAYRTPNSETTVARRAEDRGGYELVIDAGTDDRLSVLAGAAAVKAQGASVNVPENFGTTVKRGQAPQPPRPLPPAPALRTADLTGFFRADMFGGIPFAWKPAAGAASYRLVVARDPDFASVVHVESVAGTRTHVRGLQGGPFSWRVSALDADGLEGRPSPVGAVAAVDKVAPDAASAAAAPKGFAARHREVDGRHYIGGYARRPDLGRYEIVVYRLMDAWHLQSYPYAEGQPRPIVDPDGYWEMRVDIGSSYKAYLVRKGSAGLPDARPWEDPPKVDGSVFLDETDVK
jgi:hypothetical protein